jgi:predicted ATPase
LSIKYLNHSAVINPMSELKKYVITGASGSGKTTLIGELGRRGFKVFDEVAEPYILEQQAKGIENPWQSTDFQPALLNKQLELEDKIASYKGIVFLDRGIPDTLAFFKHRKEKVPDDLAKRISRADYEKIFYLEPLDLFHNPGFRVERDAKEASKIAELIKKEYKKLGYDLISVPVLSVSERADYVIGRI